MFFSPNYLRIIDKTVLREQTSNISLNLVNNDLIRAIQFDINIPAGFDLDLDNIISTSVLDDFSVSASSISNNNYRFVIYTVSNSSINLSDQTILNLPVYVQSSVALGSHTFEISNVVLSSETNQNITSEALLVGTITVIADTTAPVITLIGDNPITIEVGSSFTDPGATATDNYDTTVTVTTTGSVDVNTLGSYTLTYSATDSSGNTATTVTRTVNVVDTTAPVITLAGDNPITIEVGSSFTDPGATATDNYDSSVTVTTTGSVDVNTLGSYTITYSATDSSSNTASTTRTVNVVDTTAPVITLAGDNPITIEGGGSFTDPGATATDNYDTTVTVTTTGSVDVNTLGSYTITYSATDSSGNTATTTRTVNVVDTTVPTVICQNIYIELDDLGLATILAEDIDNGSNDIYGISELLISVSSFDCSNIGDNDVVLTAIDSSGNSAQCTAVVTVADAMDPIVICNDITITLENMLAEIVIDDIDNGSSDNCGISNMEISQTQFTDEHIGDNVVTLTVTDNNGNTSSCDAIVTVDAGLGVEEVSLKSLNIYPNPSEDIINISGNFSELSFTIYDLLGKKIDQGKTINTINISSLNNGVYLIEFSTGNKKTLRKIIKK